MNREPVQMDRLSSYIEITTAIKIVLGGMYVKHGRILPKKIPFSGGKILSLRILRPEFINSSKIRRG